MIRLQLSYSNSSIPLDATGLVTTQGLGYVSGQIKQLLQHSLAEIEILKAGKVWGENSENSAGFLKRTAVTRENMRSITELKYPDTGELCCSSQHGMSTIIANNFYITLFTPPDPTDTIILNTLIRFIPSYLKLSNDQQESLMLLLLLDIEELLEDTLAIWPTTSTQGLQEALPSLDFSNIWFCQLWLAHMRFIYDKTPVDRTAILASIRNNAARQTIDEDQ
ncbi:hypothetical protein PS15p_202597 [Mucor circinelloides]